MVGPVATAPQSFLQIVSRCDNFRLPEPHTSDLANDPPLLTWRLTVQPESPAIGLLRPEIVEQLRQENARCAAGAETWVFAAHQGKQFVAFAPHISTSRARTRVVKEMCERWRDEGLLPDVIGPRKWRGEMYPVYRRPFGVHDAPTASEELDDPAAGREHEDSDDARNYAFMMERAACALFGVVTYGVHMTIYEEDLDESGLPLSCRVWVPTRSQRKQTWPGYLDNTIAGGISSGLGNFESLVKESMEEASIDGDIIRKHARAVGSISYYFRTDAGWLQPEIEYVYDLRVPSGADPEPFKPKPLDGEVESFELLPLEETIVRMRSGLFKANTALVLIDFMIRHGYLSADNEPDYQEILTRLHGRFEYDRW